MNVIAFNGSPRPGGNIEVLLNEALGPFHAAGHDVRIFKLNTMNIKPCQDCGGCVETGLCIHSDDMSEIYDAVRGAERIILASPIFFYSVSAQSKIMIDRCQSFWCERYRLKKSIPAGPRGRKGLLLLAGGMTKDDGRQSAEAVAKGFFRTISVPEHETLFFGGVDARGDAAKHPTALKEVCEAGKRLAM
jgi:NAD(P)H-dependent FMN reductase